MRGDGAEVIQHNTSQDYSDRYEAAYHQAITDKEAGKDPTYHWPEDGDAYCRHVPEVEGYLDGWGES